MSRLDLTDDFGARMKEYEAVETARMLDARLPVYARLDGRTFSRFTRGMQKPFDEGFRDIMTKTTMFLVEKTHALIGYTQSDEISLVWRSPLDRQDGLFFAGRVQKMVSVLASLSTAKFMYLIGDEDDYASKLPHFDARVMNLPSETEATNMILWRAMDARKNAISAVAQNLYSPKELFGKDQGDMLRMVADKGVDFDSFPVSCRRGVFVRRRVVSRMLTAEELARIPESRRPAGPVPRGVTEIIDMPPFNQVVNRNEVIFKGSDPAMKADSEAIPLGQFTTWDTAKCQ